MAFRIGKHHLLFLTEVVTLGSSEIILSADLEAKLAVNFVHDMTC